MVAANGVFDLHASIAEDMAAMMQEFDNATFQAATSLSRELANKQAVHNPVDGREHFALLGVAINSLTAKDQPHVDEPQLLTQ
jgi:hypothetical protein